ncbi:hypothetical protein [Nevskia ramosa]|uniref:hypothetical protein n=1 Tax=Nevskia ramosa TaxID=64002 RepID=UPI003D0996FB
MLDERTQAFYRQLAAWMAGRQRGQRASIVGINGGQGSGKSTAAAFLKNELLSAHGLRAVVLSLDDFYLPRADRERLAREVHPLFATRGVPGTHDVQLGIETLDKLRVLRTEDSLALPQFSKAEDDRMPASRWPSVTGPVDIVLFEGWCVGTPPQTSAELTEPVNDLEGREDADGRWRSIVNEQLRTTYAEWFSRLDALVFLRVPDIDCVRRWRWQQEQDTASASSSSAIGLQSRTQLARFIQHYERLTTHALRVLPARADVLLTLGEDHAVGSILFRPS